MPSQRYWSLSAIAKDNRKALSFKDFVKYSLRSNGFMDKFNDPIMYAALVIPLVLFGAVVAIVFSFLEVQPAGLQGGLFDLLIAAPPALLVFFIYAYSKDYKEYKQDHDAYRKISAKYLKANPQYAELYDRYMETTDGEEKEQLDKEFLRLRTSE